MQPMVARWLHNAPLLQDNTQAHLLQKEQPLLFLPFSLSTILKFEKYYQQPTYHC